jgi:hypothetical protein
MYICMMNEKFAVFNQEMAIILSQKRSAIQPVAVNKN